MYELRIQDPTSEDTRYLYEEIVKQLQDNNVVAIDGIFAFATAPGIFDITKDPAFEEFMTRGSFTLLIGMDAITDRNALDALVATEAEYDDSFKARVFRNEIQGLFHPKLLRAQGKDGSGSIIVGSGNLTAGGMRRNIEAYSIFSFGAATLPSLAGWDAFLAYQADYITEIDEAALQQAEQNGRRAALGRKLAKRRSRGKPPGTAEKPAVAEVDVAMAADVDEAQPPKPDDRMLVAYVPGAGGRWHQVHFNRAVIDSYIRAQPGTSDRVFLLRREPDGTLQDEAPRPVIYAERNRNLKIELGARAGDEYPADGGKPILVMRELGLRQHIYMILFPGEDGHVQMVKLLDNEPNLGRGDRRVITTSDRVKTYWDGMPI